VSPADITFHRQVIIHGVENRKGHPHFFEAKVAVPHRAQGRALRVGWEKIILTLRAPVFFPAEP